MMKYALIMTDFWSEMNSAAAADDDDDDDDDVMMMMMVETTTRTLLLFFWGFCMLHGSKDIHPIPSSGWAKVDPGSSCGLPLRASVAQHVEDKGYKTAPILSRFRGHLR